MVTNVPAHAKKETRTRRQTRLMSFIHVHCRALTYPIINTEAVVEIIIARIYDRGGTDITELILLGWVELVAACIPSRDR